MKRICKKCGAELDGISKFCANCGAKLEEDTHAAPLELHAKKQEQPVKKKRSIFKTLGTIFFVMAILSSVINGCGGKDSSKSEKSVSSGQTIQVKADDMIKEYQNDISNADKKYKNKKVEVTGQLISKQQFTNTQNYGLVIYAKDMGDKKYDVTVDVDKDKVEEANKVKEGDFIKVSGTCVGRVEQDTPNKISVQIKAKGIND